MLKDKELKMKLLQLLMDDMDEKVMSEVAKKEPTVKVVKHSEEEVPMSDVEDEMKEKLMEMSEELPEEEMEAESDEDDEDYGSRLMERLQKNKKSKK